MEINVDVPQKQTNKKLKIYLPHNPAQMFLGLYPKDDPTIEIPPHLLIVALVTIARECKNLDVHKLMK